MKKLLFTLILIPAALLFVSAQALYSVTPNPADTTGTVDESDVPADAVISNLTDNTLHLKWERQIITLTSTCETAVCDPNTCWSRGTSTKNFDMDPHESGELLVHFYNNGSPCEGIVHLKITNRDNPSDTLITAFLFNQASAAKDLPAANVQLLPNPVSTYFVLANAADVAYIRLFALDGRELQQFKASDDNRYNISTLAPGNYVMALIDKKGRAFQAVELKKN